VDRVICATRDDSEFSRPFEHAKRSCRDDSTNPAKVVVPLESFEDTHRSCTSAPNASGGDTVRVIRLREGVYMEAAASTRKIRQRSAEKPHDNT
jgi:hypothetical protein